MVSVHPQSRQGASTHLPTNRTDSKDISCHGREVLLHTKIIEEMKFRTFGSGILRTDTRERRICEIRQPEVGQLHMATIINEDI